MTVLLNIFLFFDIFKLLYTNIRTVKVGNYYCVTTFQMWLAPCGTTILFNSSAYLVTVFVAPLGIIRCR